MCQIPQMFGIAGAMAVTAERSKVAQIFLFNFIFFLYHLQHGKQNLKEFPKRSTSSTFFQIKKIHSFISKNKL